MGVALGWVAFALAGVAAAPHPAHQPEQITYTVRYVEAEGVGWREAVFTRLKPVSRQGAATVYTVPRDATTRILAQVTKNPSASIVQAPTVTAFGGVAASVHSRSNRKLVTRVAWNGEEPVGQAVAPENVRVGWHTTMVGRKLDQGILVQIVLEDTQIRAVHHLNLPTDLHVLSQPDSFKAGSAPNPSSETTSGSPVVLKGTQKAAGVYAYANSWKAKKTEPDEEKCAGSQTCREALENVVKDHAVRPVAIDIPEIGSQEVAGEWLIPNGESLLVSFGAYTVADKDGKAVVKERLAIVGAEEAAVASVVPRASQMPIPISPPVAISGAAYPPPPTIIGVIPSAPATPVSRPAGGFAPPPAGAIPLPVPAIPSRSFPQGIHADGKPADLPKLPDDEADEDESSESSEPRPSPQTKKPIQAKPEPKPTADGGTAKAEYVPAKAPSLSFSSFFPNSTSGLQFLMPIKPFTLKLPFSQKLQIEILGRVVADPETTTR